MQLRSLGYSFALATGGGILLGAIYFQSLQDRPGLSLAHSPLSSVSNSLPPHLKLDSPSSWRTEVPNGLSELTWELDTSEGKIVIRFYPTQAPKSCARIAELIDEHFYDGLKFHRVIPDFVAQAGDPTGKGDQGSGQTLEPEFSTLTHQEGTVGLARGRTPDSADSQFYITLSSQPHLDQNYTVIGQVIEGMSAAKKLKTGSVILHARLAYLPFEKKEPVPTSTANSF